jgi:hypothetical protein
MALFRTLQTQGLGLALGLSVLAATGGCSKHSAGTLAGTLEGTMMDRDIASELEVARRTRLFFAHQSVGFDILAGAERVSAGKGQALKVVTLDQANGQSGPEWVQSPAGKNGEPKTKVDFFVETMKRQPALKADLAFMKFCYIDFEPDTDVADLIAYYKNAITTLKQARPDVRFAHATVPLKEKPSSVKSRALRLLGRQLPGDAANAKRAEFNQRLFEAFPSDPIFDVALAESTRADGSRETFELQGKTYYSLAPAYSSDGGHLNDLGQRVLGTEMIRFVARAMKTPLAGSPQ